MPFSFLPRMIFPHLTDVTAEVLRARWGGDFAAYYSRLAALADEVSGAVLCWDGAPAAACYHSSSAGQTG